MAPPATFAPTVLLEWLIMLGAVVLRGLGWCLWWLRLRSGLSGLLSAILGLVTGAVGPPEPNSSLGSSLLSWAIGRSKPSNNFNRLMAQMFQVYIFDNSLSHLQCQTVFRYSKPSRGPVGTMKSARAINP